MPKTLAQKVATKVNISSLRVTELENQRLKKELLEKEKANMRLVEENRRLRKNQESPKIHKRKPNRFFPR